MILSIKVSDGILGSMTKLAARQKILKITEFLNALRAILSIKVDGILGSMTKLVARQNILKITEFLRL